MNEQLANRRLERLFRRYNRLYWDEKLPNYGMAPKKLEAALGECDSRRSTIWIDVSAHKSDHQVRSTVLHEMCHAAAAMRGGWGHDLKFFAQLEMLLRKGAPVDIADSEAGRMGSVRGVVPPRFPLLKRKMERVADKRAKEIKNQYPGSPIQIITDDHIVQELEDAAMELPWKKALVYVGCKYGLTDDSGRPINRKVSNLLARAKKAHRRARREHLRMRWASLNYKTP